MNWTLEGNTFTDAAPRPFDPVEAFRAAGAPDWALARLRAGERQRRWDAMRERHRGRR